MLFSGHPKKNMPQLQSRKDWAACVDINYFKIILLICKALNGHGPIYLSDLLLGYEEAQVSASGLLIIPARHLEQLSWDDILYGLKQT